MPALLQIYLTASQSSHCLQTILLHLLSTHHPHEEQLLHVWVIQCHYVDDFSQLVVRSSIYLHHHYLHGVLITLEGVCPWGLVPDGCADYWVAIGEDVDVFLVILYIMGLVLRSAAILVEEEGTISLVVAFDGHGDVVVCVPYVLHHQVSRDEGGLGEGGEIGAVEAVRGLKGGWLQVVDVVSQLRFRGEWLRMQEGADFLRQLAHEMIIIAPYAASALIAPFMNHASRLRRWVSDEGDRDLQVVYKDGIVMPNLNSTPFPSLSSVIQLPMKKFNPVQYNRQRWGDRFRTKNHPRQCAHDHLFCHLDYEWANDDQAASAPLNEELPNLSLPTAAEPCTVNYQMMTEENLDDWIAQSINRSLASMVNPQKKFFLPAPYEEEIKARYRKRISSKKYEDETYFKRQPRMRKAVSYLSSGDNKPKNNVTDLYVDYRQLEPKTLAGTPIRARQVQHKPKEEVRRRNAVLLINDIHYARFLKELVKTRERPESQPPAADPLPTSASGQRQMIYSFNIDSMRRTSYADNVPNSIIQREFERIRQPQKDFMVANRNHFKKQEDIQEKARETINQKAANAMAKIDAIVKRDPQAGQTGAFRVTASKKGSMGVGRAGNRDGNSLGGTLGQRRLQQKVMKLLNNMQVISEHIDVEMSKLDIHLQVVHLRHPNSKIQNKWVLKAEEKLREKQNVLAIDCYKQALILQPEFFIPIYNIAVLLQREKMLSYAKNWFQLAKEFQTDTENVSFGLALVQIKQLQFAAGLKEIDEIIQTLQAQKKKVDMTYYYIRALCYKQLGQSDNARRDYEIIIRHSKPSNYHSLSYFLLSVVFAKSRRYTPKFNCLSFMNWRETLHLLFYERGKRVKEEGVGGDLADKLCKQPFFCRFSRNLVKKLLSVAEYEFVKKDSILFISEEESVIIVSGLVSIWSHQRSIISPDTVSVLGQGGVLGGGEIDNNLSARPNYWFLAKTELQVIRVSRAEFQLFWQGQITFEWDYKYNFLKNVGLFRGLPQATLFRLCQVVQLKKFDRNWILFNDCSYRNQLLSREGLGFCLGRSNAPDPRFINSKKGGKGEQAFGNRRKARSKLSMLIRKHTFKFNEMKFNRLRYPGLFILVEGKVEVEDDRGFRCKDIMSPRDYFGQNLLIQSEGFHNYGRMVVDSASASFYVISVQKLMWSFTSLDKQAMMQNAKNRKQIETLRFLRNRFSQCLEVKMSKLLAKKE